MEVKYKELKVAVIGCGSIGKRHIDVLHEIGVGKIIACDSSLLCLDEISKKYTDIEVTTDYDQALLEKPFAVFILTPTKMHIPMALKAIEAGAHVFIEKPLSNSSEGVEELKRTAEICGKKVMIGFCFRYHKALLHAKKLLRDGTIGRLVSVRALMGEDFPSIHPEYKEMYLSKYSGAFELIHDLDLAIWFAEQEIEKVYGVYGAFSDYEFESPDTVEMVIQFKNKCTASVHLDFFQSPRRRVMELIGTKGVITIEFGSWDEAIICVFSKEKGIWESPLHIKTNRNDMFIDENCDFLDRAMTNEKISCDIDEALKSLKAVEKIYKPY